MVKNYDIFLIFIFILGTECPVQVPTPMPMSPTPGPDSCGGFCDWKAWCPHWWNWRHENGTLHKDDFSDAVVLLHEFDSSSGSAVIEICEPFEGGIRAIPTGIKKAAKFDGRGKDALQEVLSSQHQGPIFLGSIMTAQSTWRIGHWCDVLPWKPILDGIEYHREN